MLENVIVIILIILGISLVFIPHEDLCKIPKMLGFNYCLPHWVFIYIISPAILFVAYFLKHQSAGFFDFTIDNLREFSKNPNKEL
jgi:hypothetical protein